jgi:predicted Zn-ribbon and HTH transcriptional regulator
MVKKIVKIEVAECTCNKCGFTWRAKTVSPNLCPQCKTAKWNEPQSKKTEEKS